MYDFFLELMFYCSNGKQLDVPTFVVKVYRGLLHLGHVGWFRCMFITPGKMGDGASANSPQTCCRGRNHTSMSALPYWPGSQEGLGTGTAPHL